MVLIAETRAPDKFTLAHLRRGFRGMDMAKIMHRSTPHESPEKRLQYESDRLVSTALVWTYHYMIEGGGIAYGYITTEEAFVFLEIDWEDPSKLFLHLAEPRFEAPVQGSNSWCCTAAAQASAMIIMGLRTPQRS